MIGPLQDARRVHLVRNPRLLRIRHQRAPVDLVNDKQAEVFSANPGSYFAGNFPRCPPKYAHIHGTRISVLPQNETLFLRVMQWGFQSENEFSLSNRPKQFTQLL